MWTFFRVIPMRCLEDSIAAQSQENLWAVDVQSYQRLKNRRITSFEVTCHLQHGASIALQGEPEMNRMFVAHS